MLAYIVTLEVAHKLEKGFSGTLDNNLPALNITLSYPFSFKLLQLANLPVTSTEHLKGAFGFHLYKADCPSLNGLIARR